MIKPDFAVAFLFLGNALKKDGELDEAITCFRKAIKLKPGCVDSLSELAHCLIDNGQLSEGLVVYKQCLQINPWDPSKFEQPAKLYVIYGSPMAICDCATFLLIYIRRAFSYGLLYLVSFSQVQLSVLVSHLL